MLCGTDQMSFFKYQEHGILHFQLAPFFEHKAHAVFFLFENNRIRTASSLTENRSLSLSLDRDLNHMCEDLSK